MASKLPQFVIRAEKETLDKIKYIAEENKRSATQEIVYMIEQRIRAYEAINGEIKINKEEPTTQPKYPLKLPYSSKTNTKKE